MKTHQEQNLIKLRKMRKRKNKTHFIQKKKARKAENLKGWSRQKLWQKKKSFKKKKMIRVSNLTMR